MAEIKIYELEPASDEQFLSDEQSLDSENLMTDLNEKETDDVKGGLKFSEPFFVEPSYGAGYLL